MELYNEEGDFRPSRRSWFLLIALMCIAAVLGGVISLALMGNRLSGAVLSQLLRGNEEITRASLVYELVGPSVIGISNMAPYGPEREQSNGSGVIYSADGYIITCAHVVANAGRLIVTLADGRQFDAELVGKDDNTDLALLKIPLGGLPAATFADSDTVRVGDPALSIGNPGGLYYARSLSYGVVSGLNRQVQTSGGQTVGKLIQSDAATNSGSSGGALVNIKGEVIGINSVKMPTKDGYEGMSFATPSNVAKAVAEELIRKREDK